MARSVFFSFHYKDVSSFRANVVRNSWLTMKDRSAKFIDRSLWEEAEKKGVQALKKLVDKSLVGTSVTVVLVGSETCTRRFVKYELVRSFIEGKGIIAIHINRIRGRNEGVTAKGINPLERLGLEISSDFKKISFFELEDRKWIQYKDFLEVNNRKANSFYFPQFKYHTYLIDLFNHKTQNDYGDRFFRFSDIFKQEYDWKLDVGYKNMGIWVEMAFRKVNEN